jgi:hypothetical protein
VEKLVKYRQETFEKLLRWMIKKNSQWWYHPQQADYFASSNHSCNQHLEHSPSSTIEGRRCNVNRYELTFFANHSLILETSNQFVQKIWLSHLHLQVEKHHLQQNQKMIWLSD